MKRNILTFVGIAITVVAFAAFALDATAAHTLLSQLSTIGPDGVLVAAAAASPVDTINSALKDVSAQLKDHYDKTRADAADLGARLQAVEQLVVKLEHDGTGRPVSAGQPSPIAAKFVESEGFDAFRKERVQNSGKFYIESGIRAALVGGGGGPSSDGNSIYPVQTDHMGLVPGVISPLRLLDALPSRPVTSDSVDYVQLLAGDDADYQEGQGTEKKNIDLGSVLRKADIATIAAHTTVSKQLLADAPGLQAEIDRLFRHKVRLKAQRELIEGDGAQFHIEGLLEQSMVASATGNPADRLGYVISEMEDAGYQPDLIVLGRSDWFSIQVQKDSTGRYIYGPPTAPIPPAIWNTRIVIAPNLPADTAMVIDSQTLDVLDREQPSIYMTRDYKDYATRNLVLILAELRIGLAVYDLAGVRRLALEGSGSSSS